MQDTSTDELNVEYDGDVPNIKIHKQDFPIVMRFLQENQYLDKAGLHFVDAIPDTYVEEFALILASSQIKKLRLEKTWYPLGGINFSKILQSLQNSCALQDLSIKYNLPNFAHPSIEFSLTEGDALVTMLHNENLKRLSVELNPKCPGQIWEPISAALSSHKTLQYLALEVDNPNLFQMIGRILTESKSLLELSLTARYHVKEQYFVDLVESLKHNSMLQCLKLDSWNTLETTPLFEALSQNEVKLRSLTLDGKFCGATAISNALKANASLTKLSLSAGQDFYSGFGEDFVKNIALKSLTINYGGIKAWGFKSICDGLKQNQTLTDIDFGYTFINQADWKYLKEALKDNYLLTKVNIEPIEDDYGEDYDMLEFVQSRDAQINQIVMRNRQLQSDARFKVAILAHNIVRSSYDANINLPREIWAAILSFETHPGVEPMDNMVKRILGLQSLH